ncbi:MAG: hypothetical protein NZT61_07315, partial [Deltaproteobacteria bacterium]|nr:hypothetical protein [Deltaproteobacteria bacterium]
MRIRIFPLAMSLLLTSLSSQSQAVGSIEGRARVNDAGVVLDPNLVLREQSNRAAMVSLTALEALGINSLALYSGINARVSENSNSPQGVTACEQHLRYSGFGDGEARILCRQASANPTNPTTGGSTNPNPANQAALQALAQMDLVAIPGIMGLAWHIAELPKDEVAIRAARVFSSFAFRRSLSLHHSTIQSGITLPYRVLNLNSNANGLPREIPPELERSVFLSSLYSVADVLLHLSNSTQNAGTIRQRLRDTRD